MFYYNATLRTYCITNTFKKIINLLTLDISKRIQLNKKQTKSWKNILYQEISLKSKSISAFALILNLNFYENPHKEHKTPKHTFAVKIACLASGIMYSCWIVDAK